MRLLSRHKMAVAAATFLGTLLLSTSAFASEEVPGPGKTPSHETEETQIGPGIQPEDQALNGEISQETDADALETESLGVFTTSGYCNCDKCSGGNNLTFAGTVPQADHTVSVDPDVLPIGTKIFIDGVVYTVEDIGSSVDGNKVDIYYGSHSDALDHGIQKQEVFLIVE